MRSGITRPGWSSLPPHGGRRLPENHPLPAALRAGWAETPATGGHGEGARDGELALVEAALLAADEPLSPRRIAVVADLRDAVVARRLVARLQSLYDQDRSAFQVEEIAGGF